MLNYKKNYICKIKLHLNSKQKKYLSSLHHLLSFLWTSLDLCDIKYKMEGVSDKCLEFCWRNLFFLKVIEESFGESLKVNLVPNGDSIPITLENRFSLVSFFYNNINVVNFKML